ncbi:spermatogenesis-associated protein 22 isoform X2 [Nelusetta ayraudi]|uniref:spermatogenesis-associated protein 22 isoform X2 n=1 Tax=Nelusetta ayraudi TaxID=303726 RepID=UPI003F6E7497
MRRQENQPPRSTGGFASVFNQKKRNRIPLTSAPSENDFFSHSEFTATSGTDKPPSNSGSYGHQQASQPSSGSSQSRMWCSPSISPSTPTHQYGSNRPAPGPAPAIRHYAPMAHPYKPRGSVSNMEQPSTPVKQKDAVSIVRSGKNVFTNPFGFPPKCQQSMYRPQNPGHSQQFRQGPPPIPSPIRPSAPVAHTQDTSWMITSSFGPQRPPLKEIAGTNQPRIMQQTKERRPAAENSLRILTAVINGMRHWGQFKDKVSILFEIFATLDSAVTSGCYGAKNFLLRDRKEVVQCVFYENEQELSRLIRGQVYRCVGNYDPGRDVLVCVSVRAALPTQLRNAQEAVKASNAVMRALVKTHNEV